MRLIYELQKYPKSLFITLTFDEPNLEKFRDNPNKSLSLFLDRVRKKYGKQVRHWFVAEYGKKRGRLHFHGLLFDIDIGNDELSKLWKYGNTFVGYANEITARYIVKYLTKDDTKGLKEPPRIVSSNGIGSEFLNTPDCMLLKSSLSTSLKINGKNIPLPRFYLDKMYDDREKEIISYYLYMESNMTYYVAGKEYFDKELADEVRNDLYDRYRSLGLVADNYLKRPTISRNTKDNILFDFVFKKQLLNNLI